MGSIGDFQKILTDKEEVYLRIKVHPQSSNNQIKDLMSDGTIKSISLLRQKKGGQITN